MRRPRRPPEFLLPGSPAEFPDPRAYDREGLVAVGGDLSPERLLCAYRSGIFPWYAVGVPPMWWSPDPRALLLPRRLHVSRSLMRRIRRGGFELTWNRSFREVMFECGRARREGTWVIPEMVDAYERLHRLGHAHSLEVWVEGRLCGGIYGVQAGGLFAAESMFYRATDMSKVALVALVRSAGAAGVEVFDVQFATSHLVRMGAVEVSREEYLRRLAVVRDLRVDFFGLVPRADG